MKNNKVVIDLGCGQRVKQDSTHIVDIKHIKMDGKKFVKHNLNHNPYPFPDDYADKIYADNILEHLDIGLSEFLYECHRILKQDGILILKMPNTWFIKKRIWFMFGWALPSYHPQHSQFPRPSFVKRMLIYVGFAPKGSSHDLFADHIEFKARKR